MSLINDALKQARHHAGAARHEPGTVAASVPPRHSAGASSRRGWLFVLGAMILPLLLAGGIGAGVYIHARWGELMRQAYRRGDAATSGPGGQASVPELPSENEQPAMVATESIVEADAPRDAAEDEPMGAPDPGASPDVPVALGDPFAAGFVSSSAAASAGEAGGASVGVAVAVPAVSQEVDPFAAGSVSSSAPASAGEAGGGSGAAVPAVGDSVESAPVAPDSPSTAATSVAPNAAAPAASDIAGEDVAVEGGGEAEAAEPGVSPAGKAVPQGLPPEIRMRYRLSGIMSWENRRLGIINGNFYTEGEDLGGGFRLVSIAERHVVIGSGETQYNLRLGN